MRLEELYWKNAQQNRISTVTGWLNILVYLRLRLSCSFFSLAIILMFIVDHFHWFFLIIDLILIPFFLVIRSASTDPIDRKKLLSNPDFFFFHFEMRKMNTHSHFH